LGIGIEWAEPYAQGEPRMTDAHPKPKLSIVLELEPLLSEAVTKLAAEYVETPQRTVEPLLLTAIFARDGVLRLYEALELMLQLDKDDDTEGR
jgi:hypothetical protein